LIRIVLALKVRAARRSSCCNRSTYLPPGSMSGTVAKADVERLRPSDGAMTAFVATYWARRPSAGVAGKPMPGTFVYVAATWKSQGSVYEPRNFTCVRNGVTA